MEYNTQLKQVLPLLAVNALGVTALTIRKRFQTRRFTQKVDKDNWFLQNVLKKLLFVGDEASQGSEKDRADEMQVYVDMNRNFTENITLFGLLAFGVSLTVAKPSKNAPFRAFSFAPQLCVYGVLAWEMYSS